MIILFWLTGTCRIFTWDSTWKRILILRRKGTFTFTRISCPKIQQSIHEGLGEKAQEEGNRIWGRESNPGSLGGGIGADTADYKVDHQLRIYTLSENYCSRPNVYPNRRKDICFKVYPWFEEYHSSTWSYDELKDIVRAFRDVLEEKLRYEDIIDFLICIQ